MIRLTLACVSLAAVFSTTGCASLGGRGEAELTRDEFGFTITEDVNAGMGVRGDFRRAVAFLEEGDYEAGIELLLKVVEAAPEVTSAHIDLGIAYRMTDQLEKAEASLARALEINPKHPAALTEQGLVYRRLGRFEEARASYQKALGFHPNFHFARRNLAILCDLYIGDLECAVEHYELYVQAVPHDQQAEIWLNDLRNRLGLPPRPKVVANKPAEPAPPVVQDAEPSEPEPSQEAEPVAVEPAAEPEAVEAEVVVDEAPAEESVALEDGAEGQTDAADEVVDAGEEALAEAGNPPEAEDGSETEAQPPAEAATDGVNP